jgi:hypothetical protein
MRKTRTIYFDRFDSRCTGGEDQSVLVGCQVGVARHMPFANVQDSNIRKSQ